MRRGFQISPNERFIVVEDVVTRGGRVQETIDIVRSRGGIVIAVGVIVDRSGETKPNFGCPFVSLIRMDVETFAADKLPPDLAKIPPVPPNFPSDEPPTPAKYLSERPEMTSHGGKLKEAKTTKGNNV